MKLRTGILIVLSAFVAAASASGQFANADLTGRVTDAQGQALPGVLVTATQEATGRQRTVVTAATGTYIVHGLKPGDYRIRFELEGFQGRDQKGIRLLVGQTARVDVELQLSAVEDTVTVTAAAPIIELESKEIGGTITGEEFEVLPTQNRSALLFAGLLPGVTPSPDTESTSSDSLFVNGQTDFNNSFNVDGANNDDDVIGAIAGAQTRTSIEAIQEFQVLTTQFDAEFGRALGGVLNAITKSGSNDWSGALFGYLQDSSNNEKNFFTEVNNLERPDTSYENLGVSVGGPIVRNKAHFFVNFEDISDQEGIVRSFVARPEKNFSTSEDNSLENFLVKVDYQLTPSYHLAVRYLREESPQFNQIIGGQETLETSREEDDTDSNWIASLDTVIGNSALNIARVAFTKEDVAFANPAFNGNGQSFSAQRNQPVREDRPGINLGSSAVAQARVNRALQFDDTFSLWLPDWHGEHDLRFGVQYSEREEEFSNFGTAQGEFDFNVDRPFDPSDVSTYPFAFTVRVAGPQTAEIPKNDVTGLFIQDDWKISGDLVLNLGLRYDEESVTDGGDVAPRLGFAWSPTESGRTVIRGGFGRFYDRLPLFLYDDFFLDAVSLSSGFLQRLPSAGADQQGFFDLAQANGVTTLDELRDLLIAMIEGGAGSLINRAPTVDNPARQQPYADTVSLGFQHEIVPGLAATVDLVRAENKDALVRGDLNPFSSAQGGRPNLSVLDGQPVELDNITTIFNLGEREYTAIQGSLQKRFNGTWGGRLAVTYSEGEGNYDGDPGDFAYFQSRTETGFDFDTGRLLGESPRLNLGDRRNDQPALFDRDWNIVLSGQYLVPKTGWRQSEGLIISGVARYLSGDRFTVLDNSARLDNGNRAPAAGGDYAGDPGLGRSQDVSFDGGLNGAENPGFLQVDLSFRYRIPIGEKLKVSLLADVFNATDRVNFTTAGGTREGTPNFLVPNVARTARAFQFGLRIDF
ncbi:MAG: TonB-dependent receptor [Acidobacteriota bacterium]